MIPLLGLYLKETKTLIQKNISTPMFFVALFIIIRIPKQPKCPSVDEWIKQIWDIYTIKYCSALKEEENFTLMTVWIDLENIMLSEISQSEKEKCCMIALICGT